MVSKPKFRRPPPPSGTESPEELFYTLSARAKSHAYLRGPQQDALRDYMTVEGAQDVAFELPTGAGKTMVGLLIAEWLRRGSKGRAAFLTLTNQLAAQVIEEAKRLSIPVADLRGNKDYRPAIEEGKFFDGSAVAVSTYSNLFNVNPVIKQCEVIVLDDAHGGGDFAAGMWTVRVTRNDQEEIYGQLIGVLAPLMTETQRTDLSDASAVNHIALLDLGVYPNSKDQVVGILDALPERISARYPWSLIRGHVNACHVFVSKEAVSLRPYVTPTFDHEPFAGVKRRIYLSATLGDVEDLKRAYAIREVAPIRVAQKQDGRRYVFIPGLAMGDDQVRDTLVAIWPRLNPQRAVAIAPSFRVIDRLCSDLGGALGASTPNFLNAKNIEESLSPFTTATNSILALANRYDGLDLPDDDCRLLLLYESPRATNDLEMNLSATWKLGPALRWREATRLVQGMGRCTRNATDFAIILLLGQSLVDAATNPSLLKLLPPTLRSEIEWGKNQLKELKLTPDTFAEMMLGLINESEYRNEADQSITEEAQQETAIPVSGGLSIAAFEVSYSKAIWSSDYSHAHKLASQIVDKLSGNEWAGYRAWWLYLASVAARHSENEAAELDALERAKATGINSGWLDHLLRTRQKSQRRSTANQEEVSSVIVERIWTALEELGWSGKRFMDYCNRMINDIANVENHKLFHQGLVSLGSLLGAVPSAPDQQGDPDVIWRFGDSVWVCFEAKSGKLEFGQGLSKKDVLQAKGHVNWILFFEAQGKRNVQVIATVIAPTSKVDRAAMPHKESLFLVGTVEILEFAKRAHKALLELRTKYAVQEFSSARASFVRDLSRLEIDFGATLSFIRKTRL